MSIPSSGDFGRLPEAPAGVHTLARHQGGLDSGKVYLFGVHMRLNATHKFSPQGLIAGSMPHFNQSLPLPIVGMGSVIAERLRDS